MGPGLVVFVRLMTCFYCFFKHLRKALVFLQCSCVFVFANENALTRRYSLISFSSKFRLVSLSILQKELCCIVLKVLITLSFPSC